MLEEELLVECADWIAEQMAEEGYLIDGGLVQLILEKEQAAPAHIPTITHEQAARRLVEELAAAGVQGAPDAVDERLVRAVLEWEDDFLSLAGRSRRQAG